MDITRKRSSVKAKTRCAREETRQVLLSPYLSLSVLSPPSEASSISSVALLVGPCPHPSVIFARANVWLPPVKRALATVDDYAKAVANHQLPAEVVAAAKQAGWEPPAGVARREAAKGAKANGKATTGAGSTGGAITPAKAAQHVASGGAIPQNIQAAALAAGWKKPGSTKGGKKGATGAAATGAKGNKKGGKGKRDGIFAREAALNHKQIHSLLHIMENDPKAEEFVMNAINNDPDVEEFTEKLAGKWLKAREVIPVEYLQQRDADFAASRYADALINKREAYPFAEAEAEPEIYFEERDAYPEIYFEEREAYPEAYFEERDALADAENFFDERDAEPESWIYERDTDYVY